MGEYAVSLVSAASDRKPILISGLDQLIYFSLVYKPRSGWGTAPPPYQKPRLLLPCCSIPRSVYGPVWLGSLQPLQPRSGQMKSQKAKYRTLSLYLRTFPRGCTTLLLGIPRFNGGCVVVSNNKEEGGHWDRGITSYVDNNLYDMCSGSDTRSSGYWSSPCGQPLWKITNLDTKLYRTPQLKSPKIRSMTSGQNWACKNVSGGIMVIQANGFFNSDLLN